MSLIQLLIEWRDAKAAWEEIEAPKGSNYAIWANIRQRHLDSEKALLDYAKRLGGTVSLSVPNGDRA
jgi:hypothetical protein